MPHNVNPKSPTNARLGATPSPPLRLMYRSLVSNLRRVVRFARASTFVRRLSSGAIGLLLINVSWSAHANVYATNIRFTGSVAGSSTNVTVYVPCELSYISYLLNEPASAGVTLEILSETNSVVRTIEIPGGAPGTLRGPNTVVWDVKNDFDDFVPLGHYRVRITAKAHGYNEWRQISDDFNPGNYVFQPQGIAVNQNTNSPYYGRVFVGNGQLGLNPDFEPGDRLGLFKLNADGSPAEEGSFATGGWLWSGTGTSPWKIEISDDDYLYVNDWIGGGLVLRFDQTLAVNSRQLVLRADNRPNGGAANLSGPFITGTGLTTRIWMADVTEGGAGIRRWAVTGNGSVATNDLGVTIVPVGTNSDLSLSPFDLALDRSNHIYAIQQVEAAGDPAARVLRFPAFEESGNALTNADWRIGGGDNTMRGASGIAVDPKGQYVAVAFKGSGTGLARTGGGVRLFSTADGSDVQTLTPAPYHDHTDVAWDNVGNLYVCDNWDSVWRVYSPPGANQASTVSVDALNAGEPPIRPLLHTVAYTNGQFLFTLRGRTNIFYVIEGSTNLQSWIPVLTNRDDCATRLIVIDAPESWRFYRALAP